MTFNGNPTLRRVVRNSQNGKYAAQDGNVVTLKAMAWKSVVLCAVTIAFALLTAMLLNHYIQTAALDALVVLFILLACSGLPLIIISIVIMCAPKTAGVLGFIYCMLEGAVMGVTSALIDLFFPGIALMAFLGTCIVFVISWVVFRLMGQTLSNKFVKFVIISLISLVLLEGIGYLLSLFVPVFALVMGNIWVQIAISAVFILWAAFVILVDLNNMHLLVDSGADKKYEWFAAFSLVTTLIWLYVEILEFLMKLAIIASSRKN